MTGRPKKTCNFSRATFYRRVRSLRTYECTVNDAACTAESMDFGDKDNFFQIENDLEIHQSDDFTVSESNFFQTKEENFEKDLISLINAYPSQNREFINDLLKLFRKHKLVDLPIDIRTLMQTPKQLNLRSVSPGVYFHFGLETAISHHLAFYENYNTIDHIFFDFNIDGLSLTSSSTNEFWPILGSLVNGCKRSKCFMIGIYYGKKNLIHLMSF